MLNKLRELVNRLELNPDRAEVVGDDIDGATGAATGEGVNTAVGPTGFDIKSGVLGVTVNILLRTKIKC